MSDIAEGIGGAVEGALAGRAVEPAASGNGDKKHPAEPGTCLNCGVLATDNFCANCGQKTKIHRTLSAIGHDLIHGVLHLDGKLWRTLPLLAFKPGKLTRRYIEGERAQFVSPMAMFLFSVFAMFAVFQMAGLSLSSLNFDNPARVWDVDVARADIDLELAEARERRAELEEQITADATDADAQDELLQSRSELAELDQKIVGLEKGLEALESISIGTPLDQPDEQTSSQDSDASDTSARNAQSNEPVLTGIEFLDEGIIKKWRDNPGLMLYKLQANGYKFSWLLIPLSIPFVWLLFAWKRRFRAYDHAIFVTYSLSFMSLLFITASIAAMAGLPAGIVATAAVFIPVLHIYKQLRGAYSLSRFSAIWRFCVLFVFINVVLVLFLQALLVLGAF